MNLHTPQSYEAEAELKYILNTKSNIVTAQESKPIITVVQDALIACYLMTKNDYELTREQFSDLCLRAEKDGQCIWNPQRIKQVEKILKSYGKKGIYNGRGLISLCLPEDLIYEKKNGIHPTEPIVKIHRGVFLEGAFDKSTLGSANGSLIQILHKEYGNDVTATFIDNMQFIGNGWLVYHGFSIGLDDCMITSEESKTSIKDALVRAYTKAQGIEETTSHLGIKEARVTGALSQAKDIGMKIAKDSMKSTNNFLVSVCSGAKGDYFNIAQITGLLGQQNLEGHRVAPTLNRGKRTLPHYPFGIMEKDREYEARGFVKNSFIHGLTPEEFFFHAMSGREGVCDTAMGTAKTGYMQRKIVKVCEDLQIKYDGTVRDAMGNIYEFAYGNNNYNPTQTVPVNNKQQACDIKRLAEKLNLLYEDKKEVVPITQEPPMTSIVVKKAISKNEKLRLKLIEKLQAKTGIDYSLKTLQYLVKHIRNNEKEDDDDDVCEDENEEGDESENEEGDELNEEEMDEMMEFLDDEENIPENENENDDIDLDDEVE